MIRRTGNTAIIRTLTYSTWEYTYFGQIKTIVDIMTRLINQHDEDSQFDIDKIETADFLNSFMKFIYNHSSKIGDTDLYTCVDDEAYSRWFDELKETDEDDENYVKDEDLIPDSIIAEIVSVLYTAVKHYINHNHLRLLEYCTLSDFNTFLIELE